MINFIINSIYRADYCFIGTILLVIICLFLLTIIAIYPLILQLQKTQVKKIKTHEGTNNV